MQRSVDSKGQHRVQHHVGRTAKSMLSYYCVGFLLGMESV